MSLQMGGIRVDCLRMELTSISRLSESTDQSLVDRYAIHATGSPAIAMTENQIHEASQAAYVLELRGYVEQAGIWLHADLPALEATA